MRHQKGRQTDAMRLARADSAWVQFERALARMQSYILMRGHSYPPSDNSPVCLWARRMRILYAKGLLDVDRETYLRRIGFSFTIDRGFNRWYVQYTQFKKYWEKRPPRLAGRLREEDVPHKLRLWLKENRQQRRKGRLAQHRLVLLEALNVLWNANVDSWDLGYDALVEYLKRTKTRSRPPIDTPEGRWLDTQLSRECDGGLTVTQNRRLRSLNIELHPILDKRQAVIDAVTAYHKKHGHARIPMRSRSADRDALMTWVRMSYAKRSLDNRLIKTLNQMKFSWVAPDHEKVLAANRREKQLKRSTRAFERNVSGLRAFLRKYKRLPNSADTGAGATLYSWSLRVRQHNANSSSPMYSFYTRERQQILRELGVPFNRARN